ncbi:MAG TPA: hypothetical protein VHX86_00875 [Tepidisphaeraceae bacterium]|jgi:hypothetical protein|nr:hypothetical protein [Tepidisphaeraceae bacterium]
MSQSELLKKTVAALDAGKTPYMLTGSFASSSQGEPRLTHDIDLVVAITPAGIQSLLAAFPGPDYYLDATAIAEAIARKGQFNLLDVVGGDKVDFWLLTDDPFDQSRFARRYVENFEGQRIYVSRPEDTILMKLRWAKMSGGSEKQFSDARSVYELQGELLDVPYMERWVTALDLAELWRRLMREAQAGKE